MRLRCARLLSGRAGAAKVYSAASGASLDRSVALPRLGVKARSGAVELVPCYT